MNFTLENIINSLAGVLTAQYSDYPVYQSPNQQGTKFPCFFIFFTPSGVEGEVGGRFVRNLGVDIVFVQQRNRVDRNAEIHAIAGFLDESLERFKYSDESGETALIRTFEREWQTEDDELHYQFHIRQRVSLPRTIHPMKRMEENNASVKERQ